MKGNWTTLRVYEKTKRTSWAVASLSKLGGAERKFPNDKSFCPNLSDLDQVGSRSPEDACLKSG